MNNLFNKVRGFKMSEEFNKYKMFAFWALCLTVIIIYSIYSKNQRQLTGVSTASGNITMSNTVLDKISESSKVEVRSNNFICPSNYPSEDNFSSTDTLRYPLDVINILPDSAYTMSYDLNLLLSNLNADYKTARVQFVLQDVITNIQSEILKKPLVQQALLDHYSSSYTQLTLIILPTGTVLDIELTADRKKKIRHISGRANGIGSIAAFMREESCEGNITSHEFGHMFSLKHLHEGNLHKVAEGYSCLLGDHVYDTPASGTGTYVVSVDGNCSYESNDPDSSEKERMDIYSNFMSYTNPYCMGKDSPGFTRGQISKMRAYIDKSFVHRDMMIDESYIYSFNSVTNLFLE